MDPYALAVIFAATALGGISKGATGMGMPLIGIPIIAAFLGVQPAIAILVLTLVVSNAWQVWRFRAARGDSRMGFLVPMVLACAIGIVLGTWFLTAVPERGLEIAMGLILLAYLVLRFAKPDFAMSGQAARRWAVPAGLGAGVLQGATGIASPIVTPFIHAMRFAREPYIYAVSALFFVLAVVQVPALWMAGILQPEWLVLGVLALVPAFLFMPVGQWLAARLSQAAFDRMILALLAIMGAKMLLGL